MKYSLFKRGPLEKGILDFLNSVVRKLQTKKLQKRKGYKGLKTRGGPESVSQKFTKANYRIASDPQ